MRLAPLALALALVPGLARAVPIASFAQTTPNATPFSYNAPTGTFTAATDVVFNFLAPSDSGAVGPVAARFAIDGITTGPVLVTPGGLLIERIDGATWSITGASGGPLAGRNLLSGAFSGALAGQGTTAVLGGSQLGGEFVGLTSAFRFDLGGGGLQSLGGPEVFARDNVFGLAGITPGPLTQSGGNLSGTPAGSNWSSAISGSFSAVPSPCSGFLTGLGVLAAFAAHRYRRRRGDAA